MQKHSAQTLADANALDQKVKKVENIDIEPLNDCEELDSPFLSSLS